MHSQRAIITFLSDNEVDPGYGHGIVGGGRPDNSLPGSGNYPSQGLPGIPAYPSQGLPGGGHISLLPVFPFDPTLKPDNELPGSQPGPDNSLPIQPGRKFIVKWLCGAGMILVPDQGLPETPEPK